MAKQEKVIKGLECLITNETPCEGCPYNGSGNCKKNIAKDARELLKEQKAEIERLKKPDCEHAEHDGAGCLGYSGCCEDDEPIDACKGCMEYTGNRSGDGEANA